MSLFDALKQQSRVVEALLLREIRVQHGTAKIGYFWSVLVPVMQVAVLYLVWILLKDKASSMPLILFLTTGVIPFWTFRQVFRKAMKGADGNRELLMLQQVAPFDVVYARVALESLTMGMVFFVVVFATNYLGEQPNIENILGVLTALLMISLTGFGTGLFLLGLRAYFPSIRKIIPPLLNRPLFFTSGLFFTAEMLPQDIREWLLYNPLLHWIEYLRHNFFHEFRSEHYDLVYASGVTLTILALGFALARINQDRLIGQ